MNELVERNQRNRNTLLCRLYKKAGGDKYKRVSIQELGDELGLTYKDAVRITTELRGLVEIDGGAAVVRLTDFGIIAAEALLSNLENSLNHPLANSTEAKQQQLLQHQRNLDKLKLQAAKYGSVETPLSLLNQIEDEEEEIAKLETQLISLTAKNQDEVGVATEASAAQIIDTDTGFVILHASQIIGSSIIQVEELLGESRHIQQRSIGSTEELPDGGQTRDYRLGGHNISVNFDKSGIAKGMLIADGILKEGYTLEHWPVVLARLGISITKSPDAATPFIREWTNYLGYGILLAANSANGSVNMARIYKLPE